MTTPTQLAQRVRGRFIKPQFPDGPFVLIYESGLEDGLFYAKDLAPTTLPGSPWVFAIPGTSPKVLRVTRQRGDTIWTQDIGKLRIQPVDERHLRERQVA